MLDTVLGLPLHPLVVHAVVVLLPLVALGVMALAVVPRWRARFALPLLGLLVVGAGSAVVAMLSGNELAARVGLPATHQTLGTALAFSAVGYLVFAGGWLWWVRGAEGDEPSTARDAAGWVAAAFSAVIIALTVLVGHSGATAVWGAVGATPEASPTPSASVSPSESGPPSGSSSPTDSPGTTAEATPSTEPSTSPSRIGTPPATSTFVPEEGFTMDMVAEHGTADSCWVAVNGFVYDVTDWIPQHPGGPERIIPLCGTDATTAFGTQHGDASLPNQRLSQFLLGPLA